MWSLNLVLLGYAAHANAFLNISMAQSMALMPHDDVTVDRLRSMLSVEPKPQIQTRFDRFDPTDPTANEFSGAAPGVDIAIPAGCQPELVKVPIEVGNLSRPAFIYPTCTRLNRCGGCCSHHLLSCLPTHTNTVRKAVIMIDMESGDDSRLEMELEEHAACACSCTVQEQHCTDLQMYVPGECRCVCREQLQCPPDKVWDPVTCTCICARTEGECTTGLYYSQKSCRCEKAYLALEKSSTSRPNIHFHSSRRRQQSWPRRRQTQTREDDNYWFQ